MIKKIYCLKISENIPECHWIAQRSGYFSFIIKNNINYLGFNIYMHQKNFFWDCRKKLFWIFKHNFLKNRKQMKIKIIVIIDKNMNRFKYLKIIVIIHIFIMFHVIVFSLTIVMFVLLRFVRGFQLGVECNNKPRINKRLRHYIFIKKS